jgi:nucleoporin NDC1
MWYLLSAYLFSEIYIWSASPEADLHRIKQQHWTDRRVLNEKPIYLTSYLIFLALLQTGVHLFYDYDKIDMPPTKTKMEPSSDKADSSITPPYVQLRSKLPALVTNALSRAVGMAVISPFIYSLTIRSFAWSFTRSFAKIFWNLPKSGALPTVRPFHWTVLGKTVSAGFLLIMLWEVGNTAFSAYVAQPPLKNDRPITYESKDPNGSLLTGLKGKKLQTRVSFKY